MLIDWAQANKNQYRIFPGHFDTKLCMPIMSGRVMFRIAEHIARMLHKVLVRCKYFVLCLLEQNLGKRRGKGNTTGKRSSKGARKTCEKKQPKGHLEFILWFYTS